jgi:predicted RNA-binding protein YlqC (UPF0109 family)
MSYERLKEGYKEIKKIYSKILQKREEAKQTSIFVYYVDRPFSSKEEDLVGLIIAPEDYSKILELVLVRKVYRSPKEKRLIGIDCEAKNPEKIIEFGLEQKDLGKIIEKDNQFYLTKEEKLGTTLVGKGINILLNFIFLLDDVEETLEKIADKLGEIPNKIEESERYLN